MLLYQFKKFYILVYQIQLISEAIQLSISRIQFHADITRHTSAQEIPHKQTNKQSLQ